MNQEIKILFCGDIMPGGVLPYQDSYISMELANYMACFDFRVGTLECAIGTGMLPAPEKLRENGGNNNVCFARNEDFFRVKEMGFNAMSLGNNHSFDLGEEGLRNTIFHLKANNIGHFGAGMNIKEASKPYVVEIHGCSFAFIGCCIKGLSPISLIAATEIHYGVYQPTIEELISQIKRLQGEFNYLIIMPHWGEEHVRLPPPTCVKYAKLMIDAGADGVFGSHSHCLSAFTTYKNKPIYYGMGNYLDPDKCLIPPRPFYYPKSYLELSKMPRCLNYPWSVKQPTICICGEDSRLGLVIEMHINHSIETCCQIVRLGHDNILRWYRSYSMLKNFTTRYIVFPLISRMTNMPFYKFFYKIVFRYERRVRNLGDFRKNI